jgi:hypothetical protein
MLAYHPTSDPLGTTETQTRINWYGNWGVPTCFFDGGDRYTGGSNFTYQAYRNRVISHLADPVPLTIDLSGSLSATSGTIEAHIEVLDQLTQPSLVVQMMVFEDYVASGGDEYRFVVRDILPATTLGISEPGETADFSQNFTIQTAWDETEIGVVVFVQSLTTKEVLQAAQLSRIITTWSPESPTVQRGTDLNMDAVVENITPWSQGADFWLDVELPNGELYSGNPVMGPYDVNIPGDFLNTFHPSLFVPPGTPTLTFTFHGRVGQHPWDIWQTSSFQVTVTP